MVLAVVGLHVESSDFCGDIVTDFLYEGGISLNTELGCGRDMPCEPSIASILQ